MCGIAAIVSKSPLHAADMMTYCLNISRQLRHRGPEDEGFLLIPSEGDPEVYTGPDSMENPRIRPLHKATGQYVAAIIHRRLSIIGPGELGHQPMVSPSGRYWLSYNGEIFNFQELNRQYAFESWTGTDTETLLKLLDEKGTSCLEELDGFYAGIIYDQEKQKIFAFRDKTGVKPLHHCRKGGKWFLCSETLPLRKTTGYNAISPVAVFHYLTEGVFGDNNRGNFYTAVQEIAPGSLNSLDAQDGLVLERKIQTEEIPPVHLRERLERSVARRLISDVPLGFAVSGGIDSAAIIGLARKKMGMDVPLKLFSIISDDASTDESAWQREVADFNHAEWYTEKLETASPDLLLKVARAADLPPVAWNNLAHYQLCKLAKENGVTVLFNGQGADEIFGGYPDYLQRNYWSLRRHLKKYQHNWPLELLDIRKGWLKLKMLQWAPAFVKREMFLGESKPLLHMDMYDHPSFLWSQSNLTADEKMRADYYGKKLWQMLLWEDRNSMAHSLESRNPFADDMALASFLKLSFRKKIANGYTKGILREAVKDVVPEKVLWRTDKKGFSVPDGKLTLKFKQAWEPLFMSSLLDEWSPRAGREMLLRDMSEANDHKLKWYFRLSALSAFLQNR